MWGMKLWESIGWIATMKKIRCLCFCICEKRDAKEDMELEL